MQKNRRKRIITDIVDAFLQQSLFTNQPESILVRFQNRNVWLLLAVLLMLPASPAICQESTTELFKAGINLIPYPQEVLLGGEDFVPGSELSIVLDKNASEKDRFSALELVSQLMKEWNIKAEITSTPTGKSIILTRKGVPERISLLKGKKADQGYELYTSVDILTIKAQGEAGLFYGIQTLLQIIQVGRSGPFVRGMEIIDWPDIVERAAHYDTKHHQDRREYVESFIRDLARYKINILLWEWEDKFAYPSHPEIGAPGAFTMEEMQEMTRYAQKYQVQIVPLVQGLGHVSFILKWPQHAHLREIPASNWEFCPLKDGSYELLNELWLDAIKATPGSEYVHIGCDETYELGQGVECGCKARMEEIGKHGMMTEFISRCAKPLMKKGRKVMAWSAQYASTETVNPPKGMVTLGEEGALEQVKETKNAGYEVFVYDPNPGIEPLFLPYFYRLRGRVDWDTEVANCLEKSYEAISQAAISGEFDGMINTSWDDAGLHNQIWMMSWVNSAEFSWNGDGSSLEEFSNKYFPNYYGEKSIDVKELFLILNKASYYYYSAMERKVWHFGDIGKTHLPDLPRGDNLEYDEFWNREYADKIQESRHQLQEMDRADQIIQSNLVLEVKNSYDFEIFSSITSLVSLTCRTYLALSELEKAIKKAHRQRFLSHQAAYTAMEAAVGIIEKSLSDREMVYDDLVVTWEKSRLPKGLSTPEKNFFFRQDRARHFANRRPDMTYLICDEQMLGLEGYLVNLKEYMDWYSKTFM